MKIWEAWGDPSIGANFFCPAPITDEDKIKQEKTLYINIQLAKEDNEEFVHLFCIMAPDWISAMTEYHRIQGWEEYKPDEWTLEQLKYLESKGNKL